MDLPIIPPSLPLIPAPASVTQVGALVPALSYTPQAAVELVLAEPGLSLKDYGERFGRTGGWFAQVIASEAFQTALEPVRGQIVDPLISATLRERYAALSVQSLEVLSRKLDTPGASDMLVLGAAGLSTKALAAGQAEDEAASKPRESSVDVLAERLLAVMAKVRGGPQTIDVTPVEVPNGSNPNG